MKRSKFNLISRSKNNPSQYLLYNTLHDHRILFDENFLNPYDLFEKIEMRMPLGSAEQEVLASLKEMGLVLEDDVDEQKLFDTWYATKIHSRRDIMQITVLPVMSCNLACHYCFENDVRQTGLMKPEIISESIEWMTRRLESVHPQKFHLVFFGGEPLLHPRAIRQMMKELSGVCNRLGIEQEAGMVTNGVLLKPELVDELIPYGWKWIKITFDGDRDAHDHKRVYRNGRGTFDQIYENLIHVAGRLKIAIGGNFDEENYTSMFSLIERLSKSPFADSILTARFKPIMKINTALASQREGKLTSFCEVCSFNDSQVQQIMALQDKTAAEHLPIHDRPEMGPCEFHQEHSVTIGPDGKIYKCPAFVGIESLCAGDVFHETWNERGKQQMALKKWDEHCESCAHLPNCCGGCRYSALNQSGSLQNKSCEIDYLTRMTENFMQREIARLGFDLKEDS